jgi:hypothetical protein
MTAAHFLSPSHRTRLASCLPLCFGLCLSIPSVVKADFISTVQSTNPLAYFRLESANGSSQGGTYTTTYMNGASVATPGIATGEASNNYVRFDNTKQQYVSTSLSGGVTTAGSIMAWVNLGALPSASSSFFYVAGESTSGNDFDLQFQNDNTLYFYSANGSSVQYKPNQTSLVGQWHMIMATFDSSSNTQDIYWDGSLASSGNVGSNTNKTGAFWIGESSVFRGRYFNGGIDEVAVWNTALTAAQVNQIYNAAPNGPTPSSAPEPGTNLLLGGGLLAIMAVAKRMPLRGRESRKRSTTPFGRS